MAQQLSLFPTRHLRDRTLRRNYSVAAEEFRREHERHRSWGLAQRHARRLRLLVSLKYDRSPARLGRGDRWDRSHAAVHRR
ncbi:hypothetical protein, partial [Actinoplanes lutulentus]|uniref:hypothetical protein n=1 Tax=Actinoplanes lutulentus TaxID=1287878 RepID=UPI001C659EC0